MVRDRGFSQSTAAELLGVTQAMVSKYLSKPLAWLDEEIDEELDGLAIRLSDALDSPGESTRILCQFCLSLRESSKLCPMHREMTGIGDCHACMNLRTEDNPRNGLLRTVERAVGLLVEENIHMLIPEVRTNLSMCIEGPKGPYDVASIPGRLIVVRGKVMSPTAPEFNASRHTTNLLLMLNRMQPNIRSLMNISYNEGILDACKTLRFKEKLLLREDGNLIIGILDQDDDILIDEGAFGIEPCIYIVGRDALNVARKAIEINRKITGR